MAMTPLFVDARVMIGRSLRHSIRNVEALLTSVILPIVIMLLFVTVFGGAMQTTDRYVDYVVPGIILLCAGFGSASTAVTVVTDLTNGIVKRFRTMPMSSSAVLVGHVTASVARNLVATSLVVAVGFLVGWRPNASLIEWLASAAVILMFVVAISWASAAVGVLVKTPDAASGFTFMLLFLPYVSSAFVPVETLPSYLQGFARHQPATPIIETLRGLWMGTPIGNQGWWAIAWCIGILATSYLMASWLFGRRAAV